MFDLFKQLSYKAGVQNTFLALWATSLFLISQAHAVLPLGGATLIFPEYIAPGTLQLSTYSWDSNRWQFDTALSVPATGIKKLVPYPGAKSFAFLEDRPGGGRQVTHVNALGVQRVTLAKALGHTFDGYPLELSDSDDVIEYPTPKNPQNILTTYAASMPVWGPGKFHLIGQFRNQDYLLVGDKTMVAFNVQHMSSFKRIDLSTLTFTIPNGPSGMHQIHHIWGMLPGNYPYVWLMVETDFGTFALIAVEMVKGRLLDATHLNITFPWQFEFIELQTGAGYKTGMPTGDAIYRVSSALQQRDPDLKHTTDLKDFFSQKELSAYGIPSNMFNGGVISRLPTRGWNWKADYYGYGNPHGVRAQIAAPTQTAFALPVAAKPAPTPVVTPTPVAQAAPTPVLPAATPVTTPVTAPAITAEELLTLASLPEQMTRKQFLQIFKTADPELKAVLQRLLQPEAEAELSRLGLSRYHTTFEIVGSESGIITRDQIAIAVSRSCVGLLASKKP